MPDKCKAPVKVTVFQCPQGSLQSMRPHGATAITPRHIGGGARFVDEDKPCRIKCGLVLFPFDTSRLDVRPLLFSGVNGFFIAEIQIVQKAEDAGYSTAASSAWPHPSFGSG